uniref:Si:dkeyp-11e3.1 n=1 Tax=Astyanax mexicanus TaxID=7994 RepID=A0A3B1J5Q7_ASTMX
MEQEAESPVAGKAEEQSGSLLYTYFQGDINSMVDAHFSRALSKATKPKSSNWDVQSPPHFGHSYAPGRIHFGRREEPQTNPHLEPIPPAASSTVWPGGPRPGASLVLPPMVYPSAASAKGLVLPDQQYSSSLLNLLHSDRPDLGTVMVSASKQEFIPGWTRHPGFEDQMPPHHSLDSMQMIDKKDLYWY